MKTSEEFLEQEHKNLLESIIDGEQSYDFAKSFIVEWLKEYALKIASDAYDEGFTYGIGSHKNFIQTGMSKYEYLKKLNEEL